jgi:hypothetical protein
MGTNTETTFAIVGIGAGRKFTPRRKFYKLTVENHLFNITGIVAREAQELVEKYSMIMSFIDASGKGKVYELPGNSFREQCRKEKVAKPDFMGHS